MKLINTDLLNVRDVAIILAIAIAWHVMLAPVFKAVGTKQQQAA